MKYQQYMMIVANRLELFNICIKGFICTLQRTDLNLILFELNWQVATTYCNDKNVHFMFRNHSRSNCELIVQD